MDPVRQKKKKQKKKLPKNKSSKKNFIVTWQDCVKTRYTVRFNNLNILEKLIYFSD